MTSTSREKGFQGKQEGDTNESIKISKPPSTTSSSRLWSGGFRNPRIVRVSRSFGGKDRHSKVCTIRGLRDRRIRLSVPTAIQLYELQDRLGLSQPSKVIDWLLDATKNDIDKLPPLQIPQGLFNHQQQQQMMLQSNNNTASFLSPFFEGFKINSTITNNSAVIDHGDDQDQSNKYWDFEASSLMTRAKGKEVTERDQEDKNAMPMPLLNPYYYHWDPSNLSLSSSQPGHEFFFQQQQAADQNSLLYSSNAFPSSGPHHHHHHLFFCPPTVPSSFFPTYAPYVSNTQEGGGSSSHEHSSSSRQFINHFQLLSSAAAASSSQHNTLMPVSSHAISSSLVKPFSLNVNLGNPDKEDA